MDDVTDESTSSTPPKLAGPAITLTTPSFAGKPPGIQKVRQDSSPEPSQKQPASPRAAAQAVSPDHSRPRRPTVHFAEAPVAYDLLSSDALGQFDHVVSGSRTAASIHSATSSFRQTQESDEDDDQPASDASV